MSWIGAYREDPEGAFEEFGKKRCKALIACLAPDLKKYDLLDWQPGFCMSIYKTYNPE